MNVPDPTGRLAAAYRRMRHIADHVRPVGPRERVIAADWAEATVPDPGPNYRLELKPPTPVTFDATLYQWLLDEMDRIHARYGPRLQCISGCDPLIRWLMRQFPDVDPAVTPVTMVGIAVTIDGDVPIDSLRLTYADGSHRDVRVINPPDDEWPGYDWPRMEGPYLQPPHVDR